MRTESFDVVVLGAGFGGSLTALCAQRLGLRTALIERGAHPRFAIGESSTPLADLTLRAMADRYDLPRFRPLTRYGSWCRTFPKVMRGLKRGFSYFHHVEDEPFAPCADHRNELLVAANPDDERADTHWFRADVDAFFLDEAVAGGVFYLDHADVSGLRQSDPWHLLARRGGEETTIDSTFLIDATGEGCALASALRIDNDGHRMHTKSRAIYSHFRGVRRWRDLYANGGGRTVDHPFDCDAAALHHVFDGGWMWVLRFDDDVVSAGFMLDCRRCPLDESVTAVDEWSAWLARFPSIAGQFADAEPLRPIVRTSRIQRRHTMFAGANWAMLPHAAGFVDPLHSSGIALTLSGVERLLAILEDGRNVAAALTDYDASLRREFDLLDRIVHGCYLAFGRFELMSVFAMTYFGAAIGSERRRRDGRHMLQDGFLLAHDASFAGEFAAHYARVGRLAAQASIGHGDLAAFASRMAQTMPDNNPAGLCLPDKRNMYEHV